MPTYDFACDTCGERFEELVRHDEQPPCPACASAEVRRLPSAFAVGRAAPKRVSAPPGGCGTCGDPRGPGACQR